MFSASRAWVLAIAFGAWLYAPGPVSAEAAGVWLGIDAELAAGEGFATAVEAQLGELAFGVLRLEVTPEMRSPLAGLEIAGAERGDSPPLGAVWIVRLGRDIAVYTVDADARSMLVRILPAADPASFATQEEVSVIVRHSVEALGAGHPMGFERPAPPPVPAPVGPDGPPLKPLKSPEVTETSGPPSPSAGLSVGYTASPYADSMGWQHGLRAGLGVWDAGVAGLYFESTLSLLRTDRVVSRGVALEVTRTPLDIVGGYKWQRGWLVLAGELGGQLDITRRRSRATVEDVQVEGDAVDLAPALLARAWFGVALGARTWLRAGAGMDVVLNNLEYIVEVVDDPSGAESERVVLVSPYNVRPAVHAGLVVAF